MTTKEAVALLERYSNYDGMGIQNLAGCKEAMRVAVDALKEAYPELYESEDERIRKALIEVFKKKLERGFEWVEYGIPNRSILDWLEKQKEQKQEWSDYKDKVNVPYCSSEPEWSEEDEKKREFLIKGLEDRMGFGWASDPFSREELISWLGNLRPSWKPSEKQMKALEDAFRKDGSDEYRRTINSLYQDLKKLM